MCSQDEMMHIENDCFISIIMERIKEKFLVTIYTIPTLVNLLINHIPVKRIIYNVVNDNTNWGNRMYLNVKLQNTLLKSENHT